VIGACRHRGEPGRGVDVRCADRYGVGEDRCGTAGLVIHPVEVEGDGPVGLTRRQAALS